MTGEVGIRVGSCLGQRGCKGLEEREGRYRDWSEVGMLCCGVRPGNTTVEYGNFVEGLGAGTSYVHRWHEWIVIYRLAAKQQNASYYPSPTT